LVLNTQSYNGGDDFTFTIRYDDWYTVNNPGNSVYYTLTFRDKCKDNAITAPFNAINLMASKFNYDSPYTASAQSKATNDLITDFAPSEPNC
jgi:hypothetical protein